MATPSSRAKIAPKPNTVLGLDHVVLRVTNLAASVAFYKRVLGANVERQLKVPRLVQLRIGDSLLDLVPGRKGRGANLDHFALRVAPFDPAALKRRLRHFGAGLSRGARGLWLVATWGADSTGLASIRKFTYTDPTSNGWHNGSRFDVCFAAWIPATRETAKTSPLVIAPEAMAETVFGSMYTRHRATARR